MAVSNALKKLTNRGVKFDIVFLDPPYQATGEYSLALRWLGTGALLAPGATVIAEHDKRHTLADAYGALRRTRTRTQGDATLSFFRRESS
jgi:16S rRNA G966 N2-methylase RsmD